MADFDNTRIQLVEKSVSVDKERRHATGQGFHIHQFGERSGHATLAGVRVEVTRVPVGREIDLVPQSRVEGDTTIIPVVEEIAVVEKRLVLVEEIRIRQITTTEEVSIPVTLRKQTAIVERIDE